MYKKTVSLRVDIECARAMLEVAGFRTEGLSDDEIFKLVLARIAPYGVSVESEDQETE